MRLASYRVRWVNLEEQHIGVTTDAVKRPQNYFQIASMVTAKGGEARTNQFV